MIEQIERDFFTRMGEAIIRNCAVLGDRRPPNDASRFSFEFIGDARVCLQRKRGGDLSGMRSTAFETLIEMDKPQGVRARPHPQSANGLMGLNGLAIHFDELHRSREF